MPSTYSNVRDLSGSPHRRSSSRTTSSSSEHATRGSGKSPRSDNKERSSESGNAEDSKRKEKQKLRLAEADESLRSPGARAVKDGTPSSSHRRSEKLRLAAAVDELPTELPLETDQSITPGAHNATKDKSRKGGKGRHSRSGNSPTHHDRDAKSKARRSSSGAPSAIIGVSSGTTQEERVSRKSRRNENRRSSAPTANAVEDVPPDAYQIQAEMFTQDVPSIENNNDRASQQNNSSENEQAQSKNRNRKRWVICIVISLLLIAGVVAAVFLLVLSPKTVAPESVSTGSQSNNKTADTPVPSSPLISSSPSGLPSSSPTINYQYDPPNQDFCIAVAQNLTMMREERVGLDQHNFGLTIDVTLDVTDDLAESQVYTVASKIQEKLVPPLLGCDQNGISRRKLNKKEAAMIRGSSAQIQRQLIELGANRYIIADAFVNGKKIRDECTNTLFQSQCHRVFVELAVFLKGPIRLLDIIFLISEKVEQQLKEERADDNNLKNGLGLEYPFRNVQLVEITNLSPTAAPSSMPTNLPTIPPSSRPPVEQATPQPISSSPPPTTRPIETSSDPSHSPSISPTLSPLSGPTPPPSLPPTQAPSQIPSARPSLFPSGAPSVAPVVGPSPPPTTAPSRMPSASPSLSPTTTASKTPSRNPSSNPSQRPSIRLSTNPSSKPSSKPSIRPSSSFTPTVTCMCPSVATDDDDAANNNPTYYYPTDDAANPSGNCDVTLEAFSTGCISAGQCDLTIEAFSIGCGSCSASSACVGLRQSFSGSATYTIGTNSCTSPNSCNSAMIHTIGSGSCARAFACQDRHINVGDNSCTGRESCMIGGSGQLFLTGSGSLTIGDESCTGKLSCFSKSGTVGNGSCTGENSCGGLDNMTIGNASCTGKNSCTGFSFNSRGNISGYLNPMKSIQVTGDNSCTCEDCCRCMTVVAVDGACNSLGECCSVSDPGQYASALSTNGYLLW